MDSKVAVPSKRGIKGLLVWMVLAVMAASAGAALPWIVGGKHHDASTKKKEPPKHKTAAVPFGEVVVNLGEKNLNRYLRVKILIAVEETDAKEMTELITKQKAFLKNWLIGYLFDQTPLDVGRKSGVNKIRREICDQFNAMLYPNGEEKVLEILFDEFVVQ
jgi:flagellar protein FliL